MRKILSAHIPTKSAPHFYCINAIRYRTDWNFCFIILINCRIFVKHSSASQIEAFICFPQIFESVVFKEQDGHKLSHLMSFKMRLPVVCIYSHRMNGLFCMVSNGQHTFLQPIMMVFLFSVQFKVKFDIFTFLSLDSFSLLAHYNLNEHTICVCVSSIHSIWFHLSICFLIACLA